MNQRRMSCGKRDKAHIAPAAQPTGQMGSRVQPHTCHPTCAAQGSHVAPHPTGPQQPRPQDRQAHKPDTRQFRASTFVVKEKYASRRGCWFRISWYGPKGPCRALKREQVSVWAREDASRGRLSHKESAFSRIYFRSTSLPCA